MIDEESPAIKSHLCREQQVQKSRGVSKFGSPQCNHTLKGTNAMGMLLMKAVLQLCLS